MNVSKLTEKDPYNYDFKNKEKLFLLYFKQIHNFHKKKSIHYNKIIQFFNFNFTKISNLPFIHVNLFKKFDLKSISKKNIYKILYSSGTTSNNKSKIYLDKKNSIDQIKVLTHLSNSYIGNKRLPMLVIDHDLIKNTNNPFSARMAAVIGFRIFSSNITFALHEDETHNEEVLKSFFSKYGNQTFLIFGFTSLIWNFFTKYNKNISKFTKNAIIIHGGGWKKLASLNISNYKFKSFLKKNYKISKIINYYGMIEQTGSIFFECEYGYFHTSIYSDIIIRNTLLEDVGLKEEGIVQLLSLIPSSYPGNSILTEDLGIIHGIDNCKCKRLGKIFTISGRVKNTETRGCSDTN